MELKLTNPKAQRDRFGIRLGSFVAGVLAGATLSGAQDALGDGSLPNAYDLRVPYSEARSVLTGVLDDIRLRRSRSETFETEDAVVRLMLSYRYQGISGSTAVRHGPYLNFIVNQMVPSYTSEYARVREVQYEENIGKLLKMSIPELYDMAIDQIALHQEWKKRHKQREKECKKQGLPPECAIIPSDPEPQLVQELADAEKQLGECLVNVVRKARPEEGQSCELDPDPAHPAPDHGTVKLAWMKSTCKMGVPGMSDCRVRQIVYDLFKPTLAAIKTPEGKEKLDAEFNAKFPKEFRKGFLASLRDAEVRLPELLVAKFKGDGRPMLGNDDPLIELESPNTRKYGIAQLGVGIKADINAAMALLRHAGPYAAKARALAASLFYASANRLLLLTGIEGVDFDGKQFLLAPGSVEVDPNHPDKPPAFVMRTFGGWGASLGPNDLPAFSAWDWGTYDPVAGPFRVFPTEFRLDRVLSPQLADHGASGVQDLEAMADLLDGITEFLAATRPGGVFAQHFVDTTDVKPEDFGKVFGEILTNAEHPGIFPRSGRALAFGAAGGVLQNLIAPKVGHVEKKDPRPELYERTTLMGRESAPASITAVARAVLALHNFRQSTDADPDTPASVIKSYPDIDMGVQGVAVILGAQEQCPDGGFNERMGDPCPGVPPAGQGVPDHRRLETTVLALRTLMSAYIDYPALRSLILKLSIRNGWSFLNTFWRPESVVPLEVKGIAPQPVNASRLWQLYGVLNDSLRIAKGESQPIIRQDLASEVDWAVWDQRFQALRERLVSQFGTPHGPEPVSP